MCVSNKNHVISCDMYMHLSMITYVIFAQNELLVFLLMWHYSTGISDANSVRYAINKSRDLFLLESKSRDFSVCPIHVIYVQIT